MFQIKRGITKVSSILKICQGSKAATLKRSFVLAWTRSPMEIQFYFEFGGYTNEEEIDFVQCIVSHLMTCRNVNFTEKNKSLISFREVSVEFVKKNNEKEKSGSCARTLCF